MIRGMDRIGLWVEACCFFFAVCNVLNSLLEIAWWVESHKIDGNTTRDDRLIEIWHGGRREKEKNCDCKQMEFLVFQFVYQFISNHIYEQNTLYYDEAIYEFKLKWSFVGTTTTTKKNEWKKEQIQIQNHVTSQNQNIIQKLCLIIWNKVIGFINQNRFKSTERANAINKIVMYIRNSTELPNISIFISSWSLPVCNMNNVII